MTPRHRPLAGRVLLVVGAGDPVAREVALRASALGAEVIAAGPALAPVVVTAGMIAASGAVVRVVEAPSPPLLGDPLLCVARETLAPVTHAAVAASAFAGEDDARRATADLASVLGVERAATVASLEGGAGPRAAAVSIVGRLFGGVAGGTEPPNR